MSQKSEIESGASEAGVATYVVEAGVALIGLLIGIIVMVGSWDLEVGFTADGPGSGTFPFYMGLFLSACCAWIFIKGLSNKNTEVFVSNESLKRVLSVLIPLLVYIGGVEILGIYVAGAIYITLFMVILGKYSWVKSIILSICVMVFFFFMFEVWFLVPLAKGMLDPTSFTGY